jgi:serine/threonine protein kinase
MAPEQIDGERDRVTGAADIYALAGIAYTLISGQPPFAGRPAIELMAAHVEEAPPRLSDRCDGISERLDAILLACLAKDPAARPRGEDLVEHLGRLVRGAELPRPSSYREPRNDDAKPRTGPSLVEVLSTLRSEPDRETLDLANQIMMLVYEITLQLSFSDPDLTPLLRFESRIREQLELLRRDLAAVEAQLREPGGDHGLERRERASLLERIRTLEAQQLPLQRRMVEVAERHRPHATGDVMRAFLGIDQMIAQLEARRSSRNN